MTRDDYHPSVKEPQRPVGQSQVDVAILLRADNTAFQVFAQPKVRLTYFRQIRGSAAVASSPIRLHVKSTALLIPGRNSGD